MNEEQQAQTPHKSGALSALDATPGAVATAAVVWYSNKHGVPLDADLAGILVAGASMISSYVIGFIRRKLGGQ